GATTVRLDPVTLSDPRDVGFQGFGAVLGGEGTVYLYDPATGRVGVVDATRNELAGRVNVPVQSGASADVTPVIAQQRGTLWLVTGDGRLTRDEPASPAACSGATTYRAARCSASVPTPELCASGSRSPRVRRPNSARRPRSSAAATCSGCAFASATRTRSSS